MRLRGLLALAALVACGRSEHSPPPSTDDHDAAAPPRATSPAPRHRPAGLRTESTTATGQPVVVQCGICHDGRDGGLAARNPGGSVVHSAIPSAHGAVRCASCHDRRDRSRLRLADGSAVEFSDALQLCAQCHGPQKRDYDHGAHGGMTGYWDLTRGKRTRNDCLDCHDPHAPAIHPVMPVAPPPDAVPPPHA